MNYIDLRNKSFAERHQYLVNRGWMTVNDPYYISAFWYEKADSGLISMGDALKKEFYSTFNNQELLDKIENLIRGVNRLFKDLDYRDNTEYWLKHNRPDLSQALLDLQSHIKTIENKFYSRCSC